MAAFQFALALGHDVGGCDKARDAHVAAEEIVAHRVYRQPHLGVAAAQRLDRLADEGRGQRTGDQVHFAGQHRPAGPVGVQFLKKFLLEQPPHAHAVFQLGIVLVKSVGRDGPPGAEVPLVAGIHQPAAVLLLAVVAPALQDVQHFPAGLGIISGQRIEALAVAGQAAGHRRDAGRRRVQGAQVLQRFFQRRAVVHAPAEHQLKVHLDARLGKAVEVRQHLARVLVGHHPHPQVRVGGVHRDVDGRDVHLDDALGLPLGEVRQGDVVAEQKGQALVVVLEVERFPQALGHLVDEAEHAVVRAGVLFVDQIGLKFAAEGLVIALFRLQVLQLPAPLHRKVERRAGGIELVVQHVVDLVAVGAEQGVARTQAQLFGRRALVHAFDANRHFVLAAFLPVVKRKRGRRCPPLTSAGSGSRFLLDDFLALVVAAVAAYLMGELVLAALAAFDQSGGLQLPHRGATLVAPCLGNLSLGYCHFKHLL